MHQVNYDEPDFDQMVAEDQRGRKSDRPQRMAEHADAPPDKRARSTVTHPIDATENWSEITRKQLPIVLKVTERVNVRQLLCFANSPNGGKLMSELKGDEGHADADDDDGTSGFRTKQREM